ncbi:MAG: hypothetical protein MHM6MM_006871, partial [Cercozoa sp. M6MM]
MPGESQERRQPLHSPNATIGATSASSAEKAERPGTNTQSSTKQLSRRYEILSIEEVSIESVENSVSRSHENHGDAPERVALPRKRRSSPDRAVIVRQLELTPASPSALQLGERSSSSTSPLSFVVPQKPPPRKKRRLGSRRQSDSHAATGDQLQSTTAMPTPATATSSRAQAPRDLESEELRSDVSRWLLQSMRGGLQHSQPPE